MKTIVILLSTILAATGLMAQGGPPPHAGRKAQITTATVGEDLAALDQFLAMDDAQLDQLQQAIARVRAMTPAERAGLRVRIAEYRRLPTDQREKVRAGWGWQSDADRNDWPQMMRSLSEPERSAIQAEIQALQPEHRATRKHELLERWRSTAGKTETSP